MLYVDPVTGRQVRKSTGTKKKRDAERMAAHWERELREGRGWKSGKLSWSEFRRKYADEYLEGLADKSREKAGYVLEAFENHVDPQRLINVDEATLSTYQQSLRRLGREPATIKGHLACLRAAMGWAFDNKLIDRTPNFPRISRAKNSKSNAPMKGRPLTFEEFECMLAAVERVILKPKTPNADPEPDETRVPQWKNLLVGFWLSGLRLGEGVELHWTDQTKLRVDLSGRRPRFCIPADSEKGNRDRLLPMTPDFATFLLQTPKYQRRGFVFDPISMLEAHGKGKAKPRRMTASSVGKVIGKIGKAAGVVVDWKKLKPQTGKVKKKPENRPVFASAHDLRRSFGERWSERVMPKLLMELMRHEDIQTTMRFYVGRNADKTAGILWDEFGDAGPVHTLLTIPVTSSRSSKGRSFTSSDNRQ